MISHANTSTEELIKIIGEGDRNAEGSLVKRYQKGLSVIIMNKTKDRMIADDVAQQTWLVVLLKIRNKELREASKFKSFLIQTAKYQAVMYFRKRASRKEEALDQSSELKVSALNPEQSLSNKQLGSLALGALNKLNKKRDRELLTKFYVLGESKESIRNELKLSSPHFDRVLYRARNRFKSIWKQVDVD